MASPYRKKFKWPSDQKQSGDSGSVADFVPYVSNLTNMLRKVPKPRSPDYVNPVTGTRISMDNTRRQIDESTRAADLSTKDLDAQTGAAIRVGNMGNRFRALSDTNAKEAQINAQMGQQTKMVNANIDAQNTGITNQYRDDEVNAEIAQQRQQSENISNAADKYITQQAVKGQMETEKEKAQILAQAYTGGTYDRLMGKLDKSGVNTGKFGYTAPHTNTFAKYRGLTTPGSPEMSVTETPVVSTGEGTQGVGPMQSNQTPLYSVPPFMRPNNPKYKMMRHSSGGMMKAFAYGGEFTGGGGGGGTRPVLIDPVNPPVQFKNNAAVSGTNAFADNTFAMDFGTNRTATGIDMIHNVIGSGMLPNQTANDKTLRTSLNPKMYEYLYQFNQRPDLKGMSEDQRIQTFYNIPSSDPELQSMKDNMKRFGYGPTEFRRSQTLDRNVKANGGRIRRYASGGKTIKPFA